MIKILTKVDSSMIYAVGYDNDEENLEVVFLKGGILIYEDVPQNIYEELMNSNSIGSFMINNIFDCYNDYKTN